MLFRSLAAGCDTFYSVKDGKQLYYDIPSKSYKVVAGTEDLIILDNLRETNVVWSNRSEEHTSELQSRLHLVCRLLLEKKKKQVKTKKKQKTKQKKKE